jgi:hypothetical protein
VFDLKCNFRLVLVKLCDYYHTYILFAVELNNVLELFNSSEWGKGSGDGLSVGHGGDKLLDCAMCST